MKIKAATIIILFTVGSFLAHLSAQERLKALFKKCETMDNVDMSFVKRKKGSSVTTVTFQKNDALLNEFVAAFKADEPNADTVIEDKKSGKILPTLYRFPGIRFSLNTLRDGRISVTQIIGDDNEADFHWGGMANLQDLHFDLQDFKFDIQDLHLENLEHQLKDLDLQFDLKELQLKEWEKGAKAREEKSKSESSSEEE